MRRIIIRHLTGARANQADEFSSLTVRELIVGRDITANVRFDPDLDDLVSRQHVKIAPDPADPDAWQLIDLQSRNGTFLNRQRAYGAVRIDHGDIVQVGAGGPEFRFEMDPPPARARSTRDGGSMSGSMGGFGTKPTRESWPTMSSGSIMAEPPPMPLESRPAGRATVERMLGDVFTRVRKESNKSALFAGMALAAILAVGAVTWIHLKQTRAEQATAEAQNLESLQRVNEELKKNPAMTDAMRVQIARLEAELKQSDERHEATVRALLKEIKARVAEEGRLRAKAAAAQAAPTPAPAAPAPAPVQALAPAQSVDAGPGYDALMDSATEKFQHGNAQEALKLAQQAIAKDPQRWEGYDFAGQIAMLLEDYDLAKAMFQKALQHAPAESRPDIQFKLDDLNKRTAK